MNYNINSSGLYDVNAYNLIATNATVLSSLTVNGSTLATDNNLNNLSTYTKLNIDKIYYKICVTRFHLNMSTKAFDLQ